MRHSYSDEMRVYDAMRYTQCVMFDATIAYFLRAQRFFVSHAMTCFL